MDALDRAIRLFCREREIEALRRELIERDGPWTPADEALARWVLLPWWKRLWEWVI